MPPRKNVYVRRRRKKSSMLLPMLILALLSVAIAFVAALAWQKIEEGKTGSSSSSSSSPPPKASDETAGKDETASKPADNASGSSSETGSGTDTADSSDKPEETSQAAVPAKAAVFGEPVPVGPSVPISYFDDAVFVGDSITLGIETYGVMSNTTVLAATSVNPETMMKQEIEYNGQNMLLLDAVKAASPKKIYVMLGSNGFGWQKKSTFMDYYSAIIDKLKKDNPNSIIYVQSILPVTLAKEKSDPSLANQKINDYNAAILEMTKEKKVYYLNVAEAIKDENGALPNEASPADGMHFGVQQYRKWFDYLQTHTVMDVKE